MSVLETKRIDLPTNAALSDIYKWLVLSNDSGAISALTFKAMGKNQLDELRTFEEAEFRFNTEEGQLSYQGRSTRLARLSTDQVPEHILKLVTKFLSKN